MSHFRESMIACDALLEKHGNIARRSPGLFPDERAKLERMGLLSSPGLTARERQRLLQEGVLRMPTEPLRLVRRFGHISPKMHAAIREYEALPVEQRYRQQSRLARKHGVSQPWLSALLGRRRLIRAQTENAALQKVA